MAFLPSMPGRARGPRPIALDMTPLVDLAFLLLSFFILTSSLRKVQALELLQPRGSGEAPDVMTVLVTGRDSVFGYAGPFRADSTRLRRFGLDQVRALLAATDTVHGLHWVIKPATTVKYAAVIDVLDEVVAAGVTRYAIRDSIDASERHALEALR